MIEVKLQFKTADDMVEFFSRSGMDHQCVVPEQAQNFVRRHEVQTPDGQDATTAPPIEAAAKAEQDIAAGVTVTDNDPLYAGVETIPGLTARGRNGFIRAGFPTVRSLCDLTEKKAKALKDVSGDSVKTVKAYLASIGQEFAEEIASAPEATAPVVTTTECPCGDSFTDAAALALHVKGCQAADPSLDRPVPPAPVSAPAAPVAAAPTPDNPFGVESAPASTPAPPAPAQVESGITDADLRTAIASVHKAKSMLAAQAILNQFGVVKMPELAHDKRAEFVAVCKATAEA